MRLSPDERETMAQEASIKPRSLIAAHPATSAVIAIVTIAAIFCTPWVPLYASETPKVGDFPWFYFYLLAYVPVVAIACWIVIALQKRLRPPRASRPGPIGATGW